MGKGTAFGKTIFIGDQFVLREVPAILAALPFVTEALVEQTDGEGWTLEDNRLEVPGYKEKKKHQQVDSINHILEVMEIDAQKTPIKITYGGDLLAGSGVGASAASCVSLARALNDEFNLNYSIEQVNNVGWEGEFAYHGIPSGVDNTASTYGGLIKYWIKDEEKHFEQIKVKKPIRLVLGNSGITADTSKMDIFVEKEIKRDPDLFASRLDTIISQGVEMKKAFETDDHKKVGEIMTANHKILIDMDLSHEILVDLCDRAISLGAYGAKVTGGGRGGYMSSIVPDKETQEKVAASFIADGYQTIKAEIGR